MDVDCSQPNSPFELMKHNKELHMNTCTQVKQHAVKLALLSAFAIGAASTMGSAAAADGVAATAASIVLPIGISSTRALSFGRIVSTGTAGTVLINTSGARTTGGGGGALLVAGATPSSARFNITGQASSNYSITYDNTVLTSGLNNMTLTAAVSDFTGGGGALGTVSDGQLSADLGLQSLYIGGTLSVAINQPAGEYAGTITATVNYN
jgi:hypothetical protein